MIIYNDILGKLKSAGYTTTRLRKEKILSEAVIQKIRDNEPMSLRTLDQISQLINIPIADLIIWKKDE